MYRLFVQLWNNANTYCRISIRDKTHKKTVSILTVIWWNKSPQHWQGKQNESTRFIDYCLSTSARNSIERPASRASSSAASRISSVASHRNRLSGYSKDRICSGIVRVGYLRACASVRYIQHTKKCAKKRQGQEKWKSKEKKETCASRNVVIWSSLSGRNGAVIASVASAAGSNAGSRGVQRASHRCNKMEIEVMSYTIYCDNEQLYYSLESKWNYSFIYVSIQFYNNKCEHNTTETYRYKSGQYRLQRYQCWSHKYNSGPHPHCCHCIQRYKSECRQIPKTT